MENIKAARKTLFVTKMNESEEAGEVQSEQVVARRGVVTIAISSGRDEECP